MTKPVQAYAAVSPDGKMHPVDYGIWSSERSAEAAKYRNSPDGWRVIPVTIIPTEQYGALVEALVVIDALDPEKMINGVSADAARGLVLRMGETARAALAALKEQDHG